MVFVLFWIIISLFGIFGLAFIVAAILDYLEYRCERKDLFKLVSKNYNSRKKPAAK